MASVAPNTVFIIDDSEETWAYNHKFDYIHGRMLFVAIRDFPRLLEQCYGNLNFGGWVEMQDICFPITSDDGSLTSDSPLARWSNLMIEAGRKVGFDPSGTSKFATQMAAAGFINIQETIYKWPLNSWPKGKKDKLLGRWGNADFSEGLQGFSMAFLTRVLGWTQQEVELFLVEIRKDLRDKSKHSYVKLFVVYGQKPGQPNQQPQDDSIFGSHTAHQSQPQHQQDGEMSGQGSSQEPPYQQESRPDSNSVQQPQTQQRESLIGLNGAEPSGWQQHHDSFHPDDALYPQSQHQQDQVISGTRSAQEPPHQQNESLFDSNSVQQLQGQQDGRLLDMNDARRPQQHLHEDLFGSNDAQQTLSHQQEGADVSGSSESKQYPLHELQVKDTLGTNDGQQVQPEEQVSKGALGFDNAP